MEYNIVTNFKIIQELKKYPNYKVSLGYSSTVAQPDNTRTFRETDKFAFFYNKRYKTTIYGQGYIGDISFYTDHYIKDDQLAIYFDKEEFIFDFDWDMYKEKGIEWYLGYLLKDIEYKLEQEKLKKDKEKEIAENPQMTVGNPYKLVVGHPQYNPGNVTFDDLKAYKEAKRTGLIK
jgi:hypothetical protein